MEWRAKNRTKESENWQETQLKIKANVATSLLDE